MLNLLFTSQDYGLQLLKKNLDLKSHTIKFGFYRPARFFVDHIIDRSRLRAHRVRIRLLRDLLSPNDLCFDVGANIGDYTSSLLALGTRVIAVEPQPSAIAELHARFRHNKQIIIEQIALGDRETTAKFYIREHHGASSLISNWEGDNYKQALDVSVKTVQSLINRHGLPSYIKLDVEGYELQVILGLENKINILSFEYHLTDDDCATKLEIIKILQKFGTLSFNLIPEGLEKFFWPEFVSLKVFQGIFPTQLKESGSSFFGDIFVKIA
jgi:FkbM family methyltransferase